MASILSLGAPLIAAYAVHPDPPATRLLDKTPEYTTFYVEKWKDRSKHERVKHAWIGAGIGVPVMFGLLLVGCIYGGCGAGF